MKEKNAVFRRYIDIDEATESLVRRCAPALLREADFVVSRFYQRIRRHPEAMARFPGGEAQLGRQEDALRGWLMNILDRSDQERNDETLRKVGLVHLDAGINEELMVAAMNWIRSDLIELANRLELPDDVDAAQLVTALNRVLDYNLALMLTSYWRNFQERAMRLDRLAMIGQFTATINHELRNPLGVIGTSSFLLRQQLEKTGADPKTLGHLDKIGRGLDRANSIISGLLRLLRIEQPERKRIVLDDFLEDIREQVAPIPGVPLELEKPGPKAFGIFDPVQISQVVVNLVRNAREALEGEGRLRVVARCDPTAAEFIVADDGPGITPEDRQKIFDPLFTTKSFGTGLGLTLAKSIIDSHGGSLKIEDGIDGKGVAFRVRLPHYFGPPAN